MLPKTRSGKIMRRVLKAVMLDRDPGDITTIEDEGSVDEARPRGRRCGRKSRGRVRHPPAHESEKAVALPAMGSCATAVYSLGAAVEAAAENVCELGFRD